ncbi:type II toxin-antitoxin system PemK/MazF family toxin [Lapidilactobacillus gannanensis]|uniref:Type II toxin-antitoxin system PemK/MazF family toxin n=1 Tax=Lapidilactobacillus gannanensis TaxID=2486002 RepID=A0ABW4BMW3_9LACO|nr:type II toxin-antitoxin system PemK/MazF family toxin [Lapidilactobacillus gannanensis]
MQTIQEKNTLLDEWNTKKKLEAKKALCDSSVQSIHLRPGTIVWTDFGENVGYEINKLRPALVLSAERFNNGTCTIAPLTTHGHSQNITLRTSTEFIIYKKDIAFSENYRADTFSDKSLVKIEQIRTISSARTKNKIGILPDSVFKKIKLRIKTLFDI